MRWESLPQYVKRAGRRLNSGWKREKANRENAADIKAAEIGHDQAKLKDRIAKELEDEDLTLTRRRNAE